MTAVWIPTHPFSALSIHIYAQTTHICCVESPKHMFLSVNNQGTASSAQRVAKAILNR